LAGKSSARTNFAFSSHFWPFLAANFSPFYPHPRLLTSFLFTDKIGFVIKIPIWGPRPKVGSSAHLDLWENILVKILMFAKKNQKIFSEHPSG